MLGQITKLKSESNGGGKQRIYLQSTEYLANDEPANSISNTFFHGAGALGLSLNGDVGKAEFDRLCRGQNPSTGAMMVKGNPEDHVQGWDLTFSPDNSVTTIWTLADEKMRQKIESIQREAVKKALSYLEDSGLAIVRKGHAGKEKHPAKIIASCFNHFESRALDPQLHTHAVISNLAQLENGEWGCVETGALMKARLAIGQAYQLEMAEGLKALGLQIETKELKAGSVAVVSGIEEQSKVFEKRSNEMESFLKEKGLLDADETIKAASWSDRNRAAKESRKGKVAAEDRDISALSIGWRDEAKAAGFDYQTLLDLNAATKTPTMKYESEKALAFVEEKALQSHGAALSEQTIMAAVLEYGQHCGMSLEEARSKGAEIKKHFVSAGRDSIGQNIFLSTKTLSREIEIGHWAQTGKGKWKGASDEQIQKALDEMSSRAVNPIDFDEEGQRALLHLVGNDQVATLVGKAGTGKTTLLECAKMVWESEARKVYGTAIAGKAARGLQTATHASSNLQKLLSDLKKKKVVLQSSDVIVIDEAAMTDTTRLSALQKYVSKAGAKLVLVGDYEQIQAIGQGGLFKNLTESLGTAELRKVWRQRDQVEKDAANALEAGDAEKALQIWKDKGRYHTAQTNKGLVESVAAALTESATEWHSKSATAQTRAMAREINAAVREKRMAAGEVEKGERIEVHDPNSQLDFNIAVAVGDRLAFYKGSKEKALLVGSQGEEVAPEKGKQAIENGDFGTVLSIDRDANGARLVVKLDVGETVSFNASEYKTFALGYAATAFSQQGATFEENHLVLTTAQNLDKHVGYVGGSRHQGICHAHISSSAESEIVQALGRENYNKSGKDHIAELAQNEKSRALLREQGRGLVVEAKRLREEAALAQEQEARKLLEQAIEKEQAATAIEAALTPGAKLRSKLPQKEANAVVPHPEHSQVKTITEEKAENQKRQAKQQNKEKGFFEKAVEWGNKALEVDYVGLAKAKAGALVELMMPTPEAAPPKPEAHKPLALEGEGPAVAALKAQIEAAKAVKAEREKNRRDEATRRQAEVEAKNQKPEPEATPKPAPEATKAVVATPQLKPEPEAAKAPGSRELPFPAEEVREGARLKGRIVKANENGNIIFSTMADGVEVFIALPRTGIFGGKINGQHTLEGALSKPVRKQNPELEIVVKCGVAAECALIRPGKEPIAFERDGNSYKYFSAGQQISKVILQKSLPSLEQSLSL